MSKGYAVVLTLMVLAAALFAGWYSTTRVIYFPPELGDLRNGCERFEDSSWPVLDEHEAARYASVLRAMEEPSLYIAAQEGAPAALRFTWEPSFHSARAVRVDSRQDRTRRLHLRAQPQPRGRPRPPDRRIPYGHGWCNAGVALLTAAPSPLREHP